MRAGAGTAAAPAAMVDSRGLASLVIVGLLVVLAATLSSATVSYDPAPFRDDQVSPPGGLFFFYSTRPRLAGSSVGYKRSSGQMDSLSGITLGKRSVAAVEPLSLEPALLWRQLRSMPRMHDPMLRWAPYNSYAATADSSASQNLK